MVLNLSGTWTDSDNNQIKITDVNGQISMEPLGLTWWSSSTGFWNRGEGDEDPFLGHTIFQNNSAVNTYACSFCVSASGKDIIFANGVVCKR